MKRFVLFFLVLAAIAQNASAQNTSPLKLEAIMKGDDFVGYLPEDIKWSDDNKEVYFSWNPDADTLRSTYKVSVASKAIAKLSVEELKHQTKDGDFTKDYSKKVYASYGDIFLLDQKDHSVKHITNTLKSESSPAFSGDDEAVIYTLDNNLYVWSLRDGSTKQLTDFREGTKKESVLDPYESWLENDQLEYFDILKKRKDEQNAKKYRKALIDPNRPKTIYLEGKRLSYLEATPDLNYVIYRLYKDANDKKTNVPNYVTQSGFTTEISSRPKVGGPQNHYESWIYNIQKDTIYQIKTEDLEGIYKKPEYLKDYAQDPSNYKDTYDDPKPVTIEKPIFSEDGKVVLNITSDDNKDRWITTMDLSNGKLKQFDHQHDEAWIAGPGISWNTTTTLGWIDNEHVYFQSEKSGFSHLYSAHVKTGKIKALTKGDFEILKVQLSRDKKTFYITSNKPSPFENQFYHLSVKG